MLLTGALRSRYYPMQILLRIKWSINADIILKKAQQRLFFLRLLRHFRVSQELLVKFYRAVVESVLTLSITAWYGNTTAVDRRRLNRVVNTATKITRAKLPTLDGLYRSRVLRRARCIIQDEYHPANSLFELMRSGDR